MKEHFKTTVLGGSEHMWMEAVYKGIMGPCFCCIVVVVVCFFVPPPQQFLLKQLVKKWYK